MTGKRDQDFIHLDEWSKSSQLIAHNKQNFGLGNPTCKCMQSGEFLKSSDYCIKQVRGQFSKRSNTMQITSRGEKFRE